MMRRGIGRRGPGLAGTMARTAVVAGTATAVSGNVARRQAGKAQDEAIARQQAAAAQQAAAQQAAAPPPPPPAAEPAPAGGLTPEAIAQLKELATLRDQGILTEEEFAAQKALLLGS